MISCLNRIWSTVLGASAEERKTSHLFSVWWGGRRGGRRWDRHVWWCPGRDDEGCTLQEPKKHFLNHFTAPKLQLCKLLVLLLQLIATCCSSSSRSAEWYGLHKEQKTDFCFTFGWCSVHCIPVSECRMITVWRCLCRFLCLWCKLVPLK